MQRLTRTFGRLVAALLTLTVCSPALARDELQPAPEIRISDVELFYRVYDAAQGAPSISALQNDYLDAGSQGLRQFIRLRIGSADKLAAAISKQRDVYERARKCAATLPDVKARLATALGKLKQLYPEAKLPPVTMLIGRGNSGGTTSAAGVLIGVETVCRADWMQADLGDRLVYLIAHEYAHVQQPITEQMDDPTEGMLTVLQASLAEGTAEFVGELMSGSISNAHLKRFAQSREDQIKREFLADLDRTELSRWLYNGVGTESWPGDLGYWVGYRIAQEFYARAPDKQVAIRELLIMKDARDILARSGWSETVKP
jgi:hypothetical protein